MNHVYVIVDWTAGRCHPQAFSQRWLAERTIKESHERAGGATVVSIPPDAPKEACVAFEAGGHVWVVLDLDVLTRPDAL